MSSPLIRLNDGSYVKVVPLENPTGDPKAPIVRLEPLHLQECSTQHYSPRIMEDDYSEHWTFAECKAVAELAFANDPSRVRLLSPRLGFFANLARKLRAFLMIN